MIYRKVLFTMSETVIKIDHVSKQYRLGTIGGGTLQGDIQSWWARVRHKEDPNLQIGQKACFPTLRKKRMAGRIALK